MTREKLQNIIYEFSDNSPLNYLGAQTDEKSDSKNNGETPKQDDFGDNKGMRFFQRPVFSIVRADDPGFLELKKPGVVGSHHMLPEDWLPGAKSVISVFLPHNREAVESNKKDNLTPSMLWLYSRIDGQRFLLALGTAIAQALSDEGFKSVAPCVDQRLIVQPSAAVTTDDSQVPQYSSNWSERHVGYVAGCGTFGLSTCFISKAGSAGRLISVVTQWDAGSDERGYSDWLGYCNRCGACVRRCPAQAHDSEKAVKNHDKCKAYIDKVSQPHRPRFGCGKCQTGIPCEYKPMKA